MKRKTTLLIIVVMLPLLVYAFLEAAMVADTADLVDYAKTVQCGITCKMRNMIIH